MFGGDPCVSMHSYPGLALQLCGVGVCYVPQHPPLLLALPGPGTGIQWDPVVCRGMVNACALRLSWCGDCTEVGGQICSAWASDTFLLPSAGLKRSQRSQGQTLLLHHFSLFDIWGALGIWESLCGPCTLFQGEKGKRGIDGIDGMKVNICSRTLCWPEHLGFCCSKTMVGSGDEACGAEEFPPCRAMNLPARDGAGMSLPGVWDDGWGLPMSVTHRRPLLWLPDRVKLDTPDYLAAKAHLDSM